MFHITVCGPKHEGYDQAQCYQSKKCPRGYKYCKVKKFSKSCKEYTANKQSGQMLLQDMWKITSLNQSHHGIVRERRLVIGQKDTNIC